MKRLLPLIALLLFNGCGIHDSLEDTIAPIITLTGSSTINLTIGDTFTDFGATATDNEDGNLSSSIITSGSVDTSTIGTYTITYSVSNTDGNNTSVNRSVIVSVALSIFLTIISVNLLLQQ